MLKDKKNFEGLTLEIENPAGTARMGIGEKPWRTEMKHHYGYIPGTEGVDGDGIDVLFPAHKFWSNTIYVMHQNNPSTGEYDEDKLLVGFEDLDKAVKSYRDSYDEPEKFIGPITEWTVDELKDVLKASKGKPGKLDNTAKARWLKKKPRKKGWKDPDLAEKLEKKAFFVRLGLMAMEESRARKR